MRAQRHIGLGRVDIRIETCRLQRVKLHVFGMGAGKPFAARRCRGSQQAGAQAVRDKDGVAPLPSAHGDGNAVCRALIMRTQQRADI